jgi:hypothetical protein
VGTAEATRRADETTMTEANTALNVVVVRIHVSSGDFPKSVFTGSIPGDSRIETVRWYLTWTRVT